MGRPLTHRAGSLRIFPVKRRSIRRIQGGFPGLGSVPGKQRLFALCSAMSREPTSSNSARGRGSIHANWFGSVPVMSGQSTAPARCWRYCPAARSVQSRRCRDRSSGSALSGPALCRHARVRSRSRAGSRQCALHADTGARFVLLVPRANALGCAYRRFHRAHGLRIHLIDPVRLADLAARSGWRVDTIVPVFPFSFAVRLHLAS